MKKHRKLDSVMLAAALFTVSGAALAYNLSTAAGEDISASLSAFSKSDTSTGSAISECAAANLAFDEETLAVSAVPNEPRPELLPPVILPADN